MNKRVVDRAWLFRLIFPVCVLVLAGSCSQPVGTIENRDGGGDGHTGKGDTLWLIPRRQLYEYGENFRRDDDFQIFIVEDSDVLEISPSTPGVSVAIVPPPYEELKSVQSSILNLSFTTGRHIVKVDYAGKEGNYSIDVRANGDTIGGGDGGIGIIWKED
jgi:hypothetical protein